MPIPQFVKSLEELEAKAKAFRDVRRTEARCIILGSRGCVGSRSAARCVSAVFSMLVLACGDGGSTADGSAEGGSTGDTGTTTVGTGSIGESAASSSEAGTVADTTSDTSTGGTSTGGTSTGGTSSNAESGSESTGDAPGLECSVDLECTGDTLWSRRFGNEDMTSSSEGMSAVAAMPDGGAVTGGWVQGQAVFDGVGTVDDPPAAFVTRLAPDGSVQWVVALHGSVGIDIDDLGVDAAGNIVAYGAVLGDLDAAGELWPGDGVDWSVFTLGLDAEGAPRFSARFDSDWTVGGQLAMGPGGEFATAGWFMGSLDLGGNQLNAIGSSADLFVAVFEDDGSHRWSRRFGDDSVQSAGGVAIDGNGDIVIAGTDRGRIDFGGGLLPEHPGSALVVAKLAMSDGEAIWAQQFVADDGIGLGDPRLATDGARTFLATFNDSGTYATIDFGSGSGPASGDFHLLALDGDGGPIWSRSLSDGNFAGEGIAGIAASGEASVIVGGFIQTATDFGDGVVHEAVGGDLFVVKYDADDGATQWVRFEGDDDQGSSHQGTADVAVAEDGRVYAVGNFAGVVDFGDGDLVSAQGGWDGFVAALAP